MKPSAILLATGRWPEESVGTKEVISDAHTRVADTEMLKITFRRCHNFIHGNEGMPKDAAFWQFLYLIFCKMHDENLRTKPRQAWQRRFWAGPKEQFEVQGRKAIRTRIEDLFSEVKEQYKNIFRGNEEITLSDRALAFIVSELAKYDFTRNGCRCQGRRLPGTGGRQSTRRPWPVFHSQGRREAGH